MEAKQIKDRFDVLKRNRANFDQIYQVCGEFVSQIKQNFTSQPSAGEFLISELYDSTAIFAAQNAASALLGMLWPSTAKQALEIAPLDGVNLDTELANFYERMTSITCRAMDDPNANLSLALDEYMLDQFIFGTSGVGVERGDESKLLFKPYGVKELYIDEGKNGRVDAEFLLFEWECRRVVAEYGLDKVSEKLRKSYNDGKHETKVKILIAIEKRTEKKAKKGVLAMPYQSIHMEYDSGHTLRESGFAEIPIKVGRFRKNNYEKYGRSPAMQALPDIRELNGLREAIIVAAEKALDMPKGVLDDSILGGMIDTSAGAITVFNASQAVGTSQPIFEIGTPPDMNVAMNRIEELKNTIAQHFSIDRLIDFNNETQMTFGEAQIRNQIRNASLSALFSRQIAEVFTPLVSRSVNILFEDGEFGVVKGSDQEQERIASGKEITYIPDSLVQRLDEGLDIYEIKYKTQAANASKAEQYMAILDVLGFSIQAMQVDPSVRHRINLHEGVKELGSIRSLPVNIIRQDDEVDEMMRQEQEQMANQQQLEGGVQAADIVQKLSSASETARA